MTKLLAISYNHSWLIDSQFDPSYSNLLLSIWLFNPRFLRINNQSYVRSSNENDYYELKLNGVTPVPSFLCRSQSIRTCRVLHQITPDGSHSQIIN